MKKFVSPITEANFEENWEYVTRKLIAVKKKRILEMIVKIVGNIVFLCWFFVITFGVLQGIENADLSQYLNATPILADAWQSVSWFLYYPGIHWGMQIFIYVISSYIFTVLVCGIVALLFWLLYRPALQKKITNDVAVDSKELYRMSKAAVLRAGNPSEATSTICNVIYVIAVMLYVIRYVVQSVAQGFQGTEKASLLESMSGYGQVLAIALICVASYAIWNLILGYILKLMYISWIPKNLVCDTESYYLEHNESDKIYMVEEERVITLAKEIKAQRRRDEEALMGKGRNKDEMFKSFEFSKIRTQQEVQEEEPEAVSEKVQNKVQEVEQEEVQKAGQEDAQKEIPQDSQGQNEKENQDA